MGGGSWRGRRDWLHDPSSAARPAKEKLCCSLRCARCATERSRSSFRSAGLGRDATVARFCLATRESDF